MLQDFFAARARGFGGIVSHPADAAPMIPSDPSLFDGLSKQQIIRTIRAILLQNSSFFFPDHHCSFRMKGFTTQNRCPHAHLPFVQESFL
jgi:hypothetical protein